MTTPDAVAAPEFSAALTSFIASSHTTLERVKASGPVAAAGDRIEVSKHSKSGHSYAKLANGKKRESLGRKDSERHKEAALSIQRRDAIEALTRITAELGSLQAGELWPLLTMPPALELDQSDYVPPATVATVKPAANKPPKQQRKGGKVPTLTHLKTKNGSRVHAVTGAHNCDKRSYAAALCGANPPASTLGWEIPALDAHIVSCPKCYRKLPADYTRHIPQL